MPGFDNNTMYADNVDFRGVQPVVAQITTNGQLLIGSTAAPNIRAGNLTSPDGSVTFTPGAGTLGLSATLGAGRFPITPYVVGPVGSAGYQTIQSAINAANAAGGGNVFIQPGTYTENLTLLQNVNLEAFGGDLGSIEFTVDSGDDCSVIVVGTLTLDVSALLTLSHNTCENIRFSPPTGNVVTYNTNIAILQPSTLTFKNCILQGTQAGSFIFNCDGFPVINLDDTSIIEVTPNTVNLLTLPGSGKFLILNAQNTLFDVNATTACTIPDESDVHFYLTNSFYSSMLDLTAAPLASFTFESRGCVFQYIGSAQLPLFNFGGTSGNISVQGGIYRGGSGGFASSTVVAADTFFIINDVVFYNTLILGNQCQDRFFGCNFSTGTSPAITMQSANNVSFVGCVINSSNNPAVTGTGVGILTYSDLTFLNNSSFAGTLTLNTASWRPYSIALSASDGTKVGTCNFDSSAFTVNSSGFTQLKGVVTNWNTISASQTLSKNNGYICVSAGGALALLLPPVSVLGDMIEITLDGAASFSLTQGAGQSVHYGNQATTAGVGGSLTTTQQGDTIRIVCQTANLKWNVLSSLGNLTVV